jgi:hypothetical protein
LSSSDWVSAIIGPTFSVARGYACAGRIRRKSRSSKKARANGSTCSRSDAPRALAAAIVRSSTSVRFMTWKTSYALASSQRRSRSSNRNVRKLPMWA